MKKLEKKFKADKIEIEYPKVDKLNPVTEFGAPGYIVKCFPFLFPDGKGDFMEPR